MSTDSCRRNSAGSSTSTDGQPGVKRVKLEMAGASIDQGHEAARQTMPVPAEADQGRNISPKFNDSGADFEVISGDGMVFKVNAHYILSNSAALRARSRTSPLVIPSAIDARAIEDWLSVATHRGISLTYDDALHHRVYSLVKLCLMLGSKHIITHIGLLLRRDLQEKRPGLRPLDILTIGAFALNDPELCRLAIIAIGDTRWPMPTAESLADGVVAYTILEVGAMPVWLLERLPFHYIAAIGRAMLGRDPSHDHEFQQWVRVGDEFLRQMKLDQV